MHVYGDSQLEVQQMNGTSHCLDGSLNEYQCNCLDIFEMLGDVDIMHIHHEHNEKANTLAQQASGYDIQQGVFKTRVEPMLQFVLDALGAGVNQLWEVTGEMMIGGQCSSSTSTTQIVTLAIESGVKPCGIR
jgi:hypothetical protein